MAPARRTQPHRGGVVGAGDAGSAHVSSFPPHITPSAVASPRRCPDRRAGGRRHPPGRSLPKSLSCKRCRKHVPRLRRRRSLKAKPAMAPPEIWIYLEDDGVAFSFISDELFPEVREV
ncbi:hypothetical protein BHE74_00020244 [Ensete ventricosum]|nr:hypothetical protein GW17_00026252 [Ensete ventricosum]RWW71979.1 hypothetical protein BHE74_00020244 [Ensete ventricosum]